jgi:hypothetical protein
VVRQEGARRLRGPAGDARRIRHRGLTHLRRLCAALRESEVRPTGVGVRHGSDQVASVLGHEWAARSAPALPSPEQPEPAAVPGEHRRRFHDDEYGPPARPRR